MTDDRSAFTEAREAGLVRRHETRLARALDCRNCEDSDPGSVHALDEHCARNKCQPGCEFVAPHPSHPCGKYARGTS